MIFGPITLTIVTYVKHNPSVGSGEYTSGQSFTLWSVDNGHNWKVLKCNHQLMIKESLSLSRRRVSSRESLNHQWKQSASQHFPPRSRLVVIMIWLLLMSASSKKGIINVSTLSHDILTHFLQIISLKTHLRNPGIRRQHPIWCWWPFLLLLMLLFVDQMRHE